MMGPGANQPSIVSGQAMSSGIKAKPDPDPYGFASLEEPSAGGLGGLGNAIGSLDFDVGGNKSSIEEPTGYNPSFNVG
jgi:hypothetical protein